MANPFEDVKRMVSAKYQQSKLADQLTKTLVDKIGPEGVIGMKNQDYYYRTIRNLVDQNKTEEARQYAQQEYSKVAKQMKDEKAAKQNKFSSSTQAY